MPSAAAEADPQPHTESRGVFSQSHFMALLLPIYGNQSRKQTLQTAFQKHPEKCKQRSVSACFEGKGAAVLKTPQGSSNTQGATEHRLLVLRTENVIFTHRFEAFINVLHDFIRERVFPFIIKAAKKPEEGR